MNNPKRIKHLEMALERAAQMLEDQPQTNYSDFTAITSILLGHPTPSALKRIKEGLITNKSRK